MLRSVVTLVLVITALCVGNTSRGLALLGPSRPMVLAALAVVAFLQGYRLMRIWQAQKRDDLLKKIPKRPLGI